MRRSTLILAVLLTATLLTPYAAAEPALVIKPPSNCSMPDAEFNMVVAEGGIYMVMKAFR